MSVPTDELNNRDFTLYIAGILEGENRLLEAERLLMIANRGFVYGDTKPVPGVVDPPQQGGYAAYEAGSKDDEIPF